MWGWFRAEADAGLLDEALPSLGVSHPVRGQDLQGDEAAETGVAGLRDTSRPTIGWLSRRKGEFEGRCPHAGGESTIRARTIRRWILQRRADVSASG
jgi:hypothetical protein